MQASLCQATMAVKLIVGEPEMKRPIILGCIAFCSLTACETYATFPIDDSAPLEFATLKQNAEFSYAMVAIYGAEGEKFPLVKNQTGPKIVLLQDQVGSTLAAPGVLLPVRSRVAVTLDVNGCTTGELAVVNDREVARGSQPFEVESGICFDLP